MIVNGWVLLALAVAFVFGLLMRGREIAKLQDNVFALREKLKARGVGDPNRELMRDGSVRR